MRAQKAPIFKNIRRFERKHLTQVRNRDWYVITKAIILIPVLMLLSLWYTLSRIITTKPKRTTKLSNIIDGFGNLAFPNKAVEVIALKRAAICAACPNAVPSGIYNVIKDNKTKQIQGMKCDICSCALSAKIRSTNDSCPIGKW